MSESEAGGTAAARQNVRDGLAVSDAAARPGNRLPDFIHRMSAGDQDALAALYDETSAVVNGMLLRILLHRQDAEEALLDVYMKAWRNAAAYTPERGSVQSWLIVMARSIAIDRIRQKRAQPRPSDSERDAGLEIVSPADSPEETTVNAERRRFIEGAMRDLPPEQKEVLELGFYKGFTHSELATALGQPLGTIKSRIRLALGRLKHCLDEGWNL